MERIFEIIHHLDPDFLHESILLEGKIDDIYDKYYGDKIAKEQFLDVVKADPTAPLSGDIPTKLGKYSQWLLVMYTKGGIKEHELDEVREHLTTFHKVKQNLPEKDIRKYNSLEKLKAAIDQGSNDSELIAFANQAQAKAREYLKSLEGDKRDKFIDIVKRFRKIPDASQQSWIKKIARYENMPERLPHELYLYVHAVEEGLDYDGIMEKLNKLQDSVEIIEHDGPEEVIMAKITKYEAGRELCQITNWCLKDRYQWNDHVGKGKVMFYIWDTRYNINSDEFLTGVSYYKNKCEAYTCHDKSDHTLMFYEVVQQSGIDENTFCEAAKQGGVGSDPEAFRETVDKIKDGELEMESLESFAGDLELYFRGDEIQFDMSERDYQATCLGMDEEDQSYMDMYTSNYTDYFWNDVHEDEQYGLGRALGSLSEEAKVALNELAMHIFGYDDVDWSEGDEFEDLINELDDDDIKGNILEEFASSWERAVQLHIEEAFYKDQPLSFNDYHGIVTIHLDTLQKLLSENEDVGNFDELLEADVCDTPYVQDLPYQAEIHSDDLDTMVIDWVKEQIERIEEATSEGVGFKELRAFTNKYNFEKRESGVYVLERDNGLRLEIIGKKIPGIHDVEEMKLKIRFHSGKEGTPTREGEITFDKLVNMVQHYPLFREGVKATQVIKEQRIGDQHPFVQLLIDKKIIDASEVDDIKYFLELLATKGEQTASNLSKAINHALPFIEQVKEFLDEEGFTEFYESLSDKMKGRLRTVWKIYTQYPEKLNEARKKYIKNLTKEEYLKIYRNVG